MRQAYNCVWLGEVTTGGVQNQGQHRARLECLSVESIPSNEDPIYHRSPINTYHNVLGCFAVYRLYLSFISTTIKWFHFHGIAGMFMSYLATFWQTDRTKTCYVQLPVSCVMPCFLVDLFSYLKHIFVKHNVIQAFSYICHSTYHYTWFYLDIKSTQECSVECTLRTSASVWALTKA